MRPHVHAIAIPSEIADFAEEVRQIFAELGRAFGAESLAGECVPPVDVFETDEAVEVAVDLPGVAPPAIRLLVKGDSLLIAGEKPSHRVRAESNFHLVERGYGRFARVVRLGCACETAKATATLADGELRVKLPKIAERRGRTIRISISEPAVQPS
jgi:HSP20 family protein